MCITLYTVSLKTKFFVPATCAFHCIVFFFRGAYKCGLIRHGSMVLCLALQVLARVITTGQSWKLIRGALSSEGGKTSFYFIYHILPVKQRVVIHFWLVEKTFSCADKFLDSFHWARRPVGGVWKSHVIISKIFLVVFAFAHDVPITGAAVSTGVVVVGTEKMPEVMHCHLYTTKLTKILNNYSLAPKNKYITSLLAKERSYLSKS